MPKSLKITPEFVDTPQVPSTYDTIMGKLKELKDHYEKFDQPLLSTPKVVQDYINRRGEENPVKGQILNTIAGLASGLSRPSQLALLALSGGASAAERAGAETVAPVLAKAASLANKGFGGLMVGQGTHQAYTAPTLGGKAAGVGEAALGALPFLPHKGPTPEFNGLNPAVEVPPVTPVEDISSPSTPAPHVKIGTPKTHVLTPEDVKKVINPEIPKGTTRTVKNDIKRIANDTRKTIRPVPVDPSSQVPVSKEIQREAGDALDKIINKADQSKLGSIDATIKDIRPTTTSGLPPEEPIEQSLEASPEDIQQFKSASPLGEEGDQELAQKVLAKSPQVDQVEILRKRRLAEGKSDVLAEHKADLDLANKTQKAADLESKRMQDLADKQRLADESLTRQQDLIDKNNLQPGKPVTTIVDRAVNPATGQTQATRTVLNAPAEAAEGAEYRPKKPPTPKTSTTPKAPKAAIVKVDPSTFESGVVAPSPPPITPEPVAQIPAERTPAIAVPPPEAVPTEAPPVPQEVLDQAAIDKAATPKEEGPGGPIHNPDGQLVENPDDLAPPIVATSPAQPAAALPATEVVPNPPIQEVPTSKLGQAQIGKAQQAATAARAAKRSAKVASYRPVAPEGASPETLAVVEEANKAADAYQKVKDGLRVGAPISEEERAAAGRDAFEKVRAAEAAIAKDTSTANQADIASLEGATTPEEKMERLGQMESTPIPQTSTIPEPVAGETPSMGPDDINKVLEEIVNYKKGSQTPDLQNPNGEAGFGQVGLLHNIAGGTLGGATGAAYDKDHPMRGALIGALLGAAGAEGLKRGLAPSEDIGHVREGLNSVVGMGTRIRTGGMLSPLSVLKKAAADIGGMVPAAVENPDKAKDLLKSLFSSPHVQNFREGFSTPYETPEAANKLEQLWDHPLNPQTLAGRTMGGLTNATRETYLNAGFSPEEAEKYLFLNEPETAMGSAGMDLTRKLPILRHLDPFVRVGVNRIEQGYKRSPLGLTSFFGEGSITPEQAANMKKLAAMGTTASAGAAYLTPPDFVKNHPIATGLITAGSGVYGLPILAGMAAKSFNKKSGEPYLDLARTARETEKDAPWLRTVQDIASPKAFARNYFSSYTSDLRPVAEEIAKLRGEPEPNVKGEDLPYVQQLFNQTGANVPGVRELLPSKPFNPNDLTKDLFKDLPKYSSLKIIPEF